jgi:hypothetical protein
VVVSASDYTGRHVSLSLSPAPGDGREAEAHAERVRQAQTRAALAHPLDGPTAIAIVRELIEAFDGEPRVESPAHLYSEVVYLRNTMRRQADELGEARYREKASRSDLERRQAAELERLRAQVRVLQLRLGEVIS